MNSKPPNSETPRRFIAGAVCPRCAAMDRIVVSADGETRSCIACGYEDGRPQDQDPQSLPTRVTRAASRRTETRAEPVRMLDGGLTPKKDTDK